MTLISIILAVYNEDRYLPKCLLSLIDQTIDNFEIIVVDDGSTKPVVLPDKLTGSDIPVSLYRIVHGGTAVARNFGVSKAKGEIVVFVDGDMEFTPEFLANLTQPIRQGHAKGSFSVEEYVANWNQELARCWNYEHGLSGRKRIDESKINMIRDFRAILKSEFTRVKGFDDIGYTDTWTLSEKLGFLPVATEARYFHYNPETYSEVYSQAKWIGGRVRRKGLLGKILSLVRVIVPVSLINGLRMAVTYKTVTAVPFKVVYDLGIFMGLIMGRRKK